MSAFDGDGTIFQSGSALYSRLFLEITLSAKRQSSNSAPRLHRSSCPWIRTLSLMRNDRQDRIVADIISVSSLLTLAGLDDPKSAPPFSEIVLDQIKKIREQFESGKEARISAGRESGDGDEGVDVGRTYPAWGGEGPGQIENEMASFTHEVWMDQNGDAVDMDKVGQGSAQEGEEAFWKEKMMGGRPGGAGGPGQVVMGV